MGDNSPHQNTYLMVTEDNYTGLFLLQ